MSIELLFIVLFLCSFNDSMAFIMQTNEDKHASNFIQVRRIMLISIIKMIQKSTRIKKWRVEC